MTNPVQELIEREINEHDVVLFMKGTPVFPECGFSSLVVQVLSHLGVKFRGIDVLSDPACGRPSRISPIGRRFRSSMLKASSSAAAISFARCSKPASSLNSWPHAALRLLPFRPHRIVSRRPKASRAPRYPHWFEY